MLDAYIIDAIKQEEARKREEANEGRRLWLELPMEAPGYPEEQSEEQPPPSSGPIVIPLSPGVPDYDEDAA